MVEKTIYEMESTYREKMEVRAFSFGKGEKSACIFGPLRGNEIQQLYICGQLVHALLELENKGCISSGKEIMVVPCVNYFGMNVGNRFWPVDNMDLNRKFPGTDYGDTTDRIANGVLEAVKEYSYGIQFASFYMTGEFVPHVRMMETGFQNTSLANLFGMQYVAVRKPKPIDTKTLNYNWQNDMTAAFSIYTNKNDEIDEKSAKAAVAAVLRFLMRMGIIKYESHSGYISHVIYEDDLTNVPALESGIIRPVVSAGEDVRYGQIMADIVDPYRGDVISHVKATTDGIVFFAHTSPLINQGDIAYRLIHRLHE